MHVALYGVVIAVPHCGIKLYIWTGMRVSS